MSCPLQLSILFLAFYCLGFTTSIRLPHLPSKSTASKAHLTTGNDDTRDEWQDITSTAKETTTDTIDLSEPLLQTSCTLQLVPNADDKGAIPKKHNDIRACCDTGAQRTCMSWITAKRLGLAHLMDHRYSDADSNGGGSHQYAIGIGGGKCRVLGRIPAQTVLLHFENHSNNNNDDNETGNKDTSSSTTTITTRRTVLLPAINVLESATGLPSDV